MSLSNSIIFSPLRIGPLLLRNRIIRSATGEGLATQDGSPTSALGQLYTNLAKGEVGMIISGLVAVSSKARTSRSMSGLYSQSHLNSWLPIVSSVHQFPSKLILQLAHGGLNLMKDNALGITPADPSIITNNEIEDIIHSFIQAAQLASIAGADGVQLHAAHGFLLSGFLSPAENRRNDKWGGSPENRARIVVEIISGIRRAVPEGFSLSIKLNSNDYVPGGVDPILSAKYVDLLKNQIDFFEISCGLSRGKFYNIRSNINKKLLLLDVPDEKKQSLLESAKNLAVPYFDQYNIADQKYIRSLHPNVKLASVGGHRTLKHIENVLTEGIADLVSLCRPFIQDPHFVKKLREGKITSSSCINCGSCVFNLAQGSYCRMNRK